MYMKGSNPCFTSMEVKSLKDFFEKIREKSPIGVRKFCSVSSVSTRTYAKMLKLQPIKYECYHRLFIGAAYSADPQVFMEQWSHLGESFYWQYNP